MLEITAMRGRVKSVNGDNKPSVEVPDLGVGYVFGPCDTISDVVFKAGQHVLVISVGGVPEDVVVLGVLNPQVGEARYDPRYVLR